MLQGAQPSGWWASRLIRLSIGGVLICAGVALGIGLFALVDTLDIEPEPSAALQLGAGLADGCTTLALDRDNGRTEAEPCPDVGAQVARAGNAQLFVATAY
jgi:hypothetical protein